ncbi:hypothetical protein J4453_03565 [Candidatus Woesearchaeota archaeon]|nr:hypothetical protein [Candidatus Woesearchaeota archaeon]
MEKKVGHYSFIIGVIIAIVLGLALPLGSDTTVWLTSILVVLGLIVGFLNVTGKETKEFLTVGTILVIVAFAGNASTTLNQVIYLGQYLSGIFSAMLAFVVPSVVVVALKDVWALGQNN